MVILITLDIVEVIGRIAVVIIKMDKMITIMITIMISLAKMAKMRNIFSEMVQDQEIIKT